jgi:hypothetical protein
MACLESWPRKPISLPGCRVPHAVPSCRRYFLHYTCFYHDTQLAYPTYERSLSYQSWLVLNTTIGTAHNAASCMGVSNTTVEALKLSCPLVDILVMPRRFSSLVFRRPLSTHYIRGTLPYFIRWCSDSLRQVYVARQLKRHPMLLSINLFRHITNSE